MKKGQVYEATIERVDFPNRGIAKAGEETIVVKNSLPGQKVKLCVNKVRNGKAEGRLLEVLEKSPLETDVPCSLFGICGGCTFLSLPYEEQLKIKENQVKRLLSACLENQEDPWDWEGIQGSPAVYEYRNKMEFSFGDEVKEGPLTLGMHKRGSFYDVVTVDGCRIVDDDYRIILKTVREYFDQGYKKHKGTVPDEDLYGSDAGRRIQYFHRLRHEGYLRHLVVRKAAHTGEILVALVTTSQDPFGKQEETGRGMAEKNLLAGFLDELLELEHSQRLKGRYAGILHIVNDSQADIVQSDHKDVLYGQDFFYEELLGMRFKVSIFSFFQTNTRGAEVLYRKVREYIGKLEGGCEDSRYDGVVYDLYSGTGTIAQMAAPAAGKVIGVEIVEEAVHAAKKNAMENGLDNCEFIAGDVLKVLDGIEEKPDMIILDPPRDGIHPKALLKIISYGVERIVYISCKPTSLVRDLREFMQRGYAVKKACCVDMFPHTANVETVVMLSKGEIDSKKVRVEFSLEDMDMSGFQKGATYEQIKAYVLEHTGLKVSSLYISQIKRKCGLDVGQNYNLSKKEDAKVPQCPPEKEAAITEALKFFGMI